MVNDFLKLLENKNYSIIITIITIIILIYALYQKIKFHCLEEASKMVAEAESHSELSGKEKFSLVVLWINEELPSIFRNSFFQTIIQKLIEFAYNTSFDYMKKYVKRKTGYDISTLIENIEQNKKEDKTESE